MLSSMIRAGASISRSRVRLVLSFKKFSFVLKLVHFPLCLGFGIELSRPLVASLSNTTLHLGKRITLEFFSLHLLRKSINSSSAVG